MRLERIREWNFGDVMKAIRVRAGMHSSVSARLILMPETARNLGGSGVSDGLQPVRSGG